MENRLYNQGGAWYHAKKAEAAGPPTDQRGLEHYEEEISEVQ